MPRGGFLWDANIDFLRFSGLELGNPLYFAFTAILGGHGLIELHQLGGLDMSSLRRANLGMYALGIGSAADVILGARRQLWVRSGHDLGGGCRLRVSSRTRAGRHARPLCTQNRTPTPTNGTAASGQ
jgi:hypothetical protein